MDKERIRAKEKIMNLGNWLANNIIKDHVDVDTVEEFIVSGNVQQILEANATSTSANGDADDGPTTWFKNNSDYKRVSKKKALALGMQVIDYLLGKEAFDGIVNDNIPSYYPAGVPGASTTTNKDYKQNKAFKMYQKRIKDIIHLMVKHLMIT